MNLFLDGLGLIFFMSLGGILVRGLLPVFTGSKPDFAFLSQSWIVGFVGVLGLLLTYGTVRSQLQQNSDNAFNEQGVFFVQSEYDEPYFRCLYSWHAHNDPDGCLQGIASSETLYTKTMLYIEEVFYILTAANIERTLWRSRYTEDVGYWREDVSADPTGLFSYQTVVENPEDPQAALQRAGVEIDPDRLCLNYRRVHRQLVLSGAAPGRLLTCKTSRDVDLDITPRRRDSSEAKAGRQSVILIELEREAETKGSP